MTPIATVHTTHEHPTHLPAGPLAAGKRVSWGAVFAGAILALVIQLSLSLLGLGIGLGTIDPTQEQNPMSGIGTGAVIWWAISTLASLYLGATVAARLAGVPRRTDSLLHGLLTWSIVTLLTFYLLTTAVGRIIGGVTGVAGRALSGVGSGVAAVAPGAGDLIKEELQKQGITMNDIKQQATLLLRQTGKSTLDPKNLENEAKSAGSDAKNAAANSAADPMAADDNFDSLLDRLTSQAGEVGNAADRDAAVNVVMKRTGKSRAESEQIVDNWIATAKQAQAKLAEAKDKAGAEARKLGEAAADGLSKAALLMALGLGLGAAVAAFGGWRATPVRAALAEGEVVA
jgi:hypothetical protein